MNDEESTQAQLHDEAIWKCDMDIDTAPIQAQVQDQTNTQPVVDGEYDKSDYLFGSVTFMVVVMVFYLLANTTTGEKELTQQANKLTRNGRSQQFKLPRLSTADRNMIMSTVWYHVYP
ncbi:hypothetical protein BC941DRAFT_454610 [Chlamydoabsidia padenii]|nr:hypothetical protein BC941DRAFT_454610 [Chlamydoabsidia padenii]